MMNDTRINMVLFTICYDIAGNKNLPNLTESSEQTNIERNKPTASSLGGKNLTTEVKDWWKSQGLQSSDSESED